MNAARMNMAENGHSTWVKAGAVQLTLVDAARHDVGENLRLEKTMERFLEGSLKSTGKGPSSKEMNRRLRESQLQRARCYGREILEAEFTGDPYSSADAVGCVDPNSSYSPTKRGKKGKSSAKSQMSKQLAKSINCAKSEASEMVLNGTLHIATDHVKFMVKHGQNSYEVDICHTPSCSCPDTRPCYCKHVIWVLMFVLNATEEDPILKEKRPTKSMLEDILSGKAPTNSSKSVTSQPSQASQNSAQTSQDPGQASQTSATGSRSLLPAPQHSAPAFQCFPHASRPSVDASRSQTSTNLSAS